MKPTSKLCTFEIVLLLVALQALVGIAYGSSSSSSDDGGGGTTKTTKRVGVVLSEGFELLDAMGPYEALKEVEEHYYSAIDIEHRSWNKDVDSGIQCADGSLEVEVLLAAFGTGTVKSSSGVGVVPDFDLSQDPHATHFDLLVLGADALDASDQSAMEYLKAHHDVGGSILTVCTGAKFVASLGLLDGAEATTNSLFLETFAVDYPRVEWVSLADNTQRRFVRSTKQIVTTAGITAGIDGSLEQIYEWCGFEVAEAIRECLEWPLPIEIAETTTSTTATTSATTTIGLGKNKSDGAIETDL